MVTIRPAKTSDILGITEIWKDFMDFHSEIDPFWTRSQNGHQKMITFVDSCLKNHDFLILVAEETQKLVGYQIAEITDHPPVLVRTRYCLINDIAVIASYRNRGVGRKLYNQAVEWAQRKKVNRVELQVAANNESAYKFYEKLGFKPFLRRLYQDIG